ncbi:MAG: hypothetical protein ACK5MO_00760 [Planctomyces sp.]
MNRSVLLLTVFFFVAAAGAESRSAADEKGVVSGAVVRVSVERVGEQLLAWLRQAGVDAEQAEAAGVVWRQGAMAADLSAEEALDLLLASLSAADAETAALVRACHAGQPPLSQQYTGAKQEPVYRDNVRVWHARALVQQRYYDEACLLLADISVEGLVDPAALLFYRGISRLKLLQKSGAADDLTLLLNSTADVPARFRAVAEQMQAESAKPAGSLGEVPQLMSDVQRRLDLGAADEPVQKREDQIVAALDKLLKELEDQQKQQRQQPQQAGPGGNAQQPQQSGGQAQVRGAAGAGEAERKELNENGAWGMLNKEREAQAKELIRQQFPPNFLDAISRYTRKIAEQKK